MTKAEARNLFLGKRLALSEGERDILNNKLVHQFFSNFDLSFVHNLHLFLPIESRKEPDTWSIIDRIRREFPHVRLVVPKMNASGSLMHYYFESSDKLTKSSLGIMEPVDCVVADVSEIELVIAPLLAVDFLGNRVGYGKGFYDRFLATCRKDCRTTGLSFFDPVSEPIEQAEHDIRLMSCVTPTQVIEF